MSSNIFTILGELGTVFLDIKHILKFKKEGRTNEELRKSAYPSMYIGGIAAAVLVVLGVSLLLNFRYRVNPRETQQEINEIGLAITEWKELNGEYPISIEEMTAMRPLRAEWLTDHWGRAYKYEILNGDKFILTSSGIDGEFDTDDDITTSYNNVYN